MQIAIGTGLLRLEPFRAAQARCGDVPGPVGMDIPGMCHYLSLEMPRHRGHGAGTGSTSPDGAAPVPVVPPSSSPSPLEDKAIFKRAGQETSWQEEKEKDQDCC